MKLLNFVLVYKFYLDSEYGVFGSLMGQQMALYGYVRTPICTMREKERVSECKCPALMQHTSSEMRVSVTETNRLAEVFTDQRDIWSWTVRTWDVH